MGIGTLLATSVPVTLLVAEGNLPKTTSCIFSSFFCDKVYGLVWSYNVSAEIPKSHSSLWIDWRVISHEFVIYFVVNMKLK